MCREITEGTKYSCTHYVVTFNAARWDCNKANCTKSQRHPDPCKSCKSQSCVQIYGPEVEKITATSEKPCPSCR